MDRHDTNRPDDSAGIRLTGTPQQDHDTLAELFLGDAPFAPQPMSGSDLSDGAATNADESRGQSKPTEPGRRSVSRYDGSAVRTMSPEDSDASEGGHPIVEMVVLGHLPVRASLWVRQYACQSARKRSETVALLRTAGDSIALDLITGGERSEIEPIDDIADAMTVAKAAASRVIVRVDETAEPELLEREGVDEVTILTGADEAAVVASYRLIKSLVSTLENRLDPDASPVLRVAVMGGAGEDIKAACAKIERACRAFLERPIEILDASGRIDATGTTSVCRLDGTGVADAALDALLGSAIEVGSESASESMLRLASDVDAEPGVPDIVVVPGEVRGVGFGNADPVAAEIEAKPAKRAAERDEARQESDSGASDDASATATAMRPVARLGLRLPELIESLLPLETRCPKARGVWFATDSIGGLHAVVMDDTEDPVASLVAARAWAMENLPLLLRAEPNLAMPSAEPDDESGVGLHLLTRTPKRWRGVFDSEVLVYAVAGVTVGGEDHLVATLINE